jgi:hypothetical protein
MHKARGLDPSILTLDAEADMLITKEMQMV